MRRIYVHCDMCGKGHAHLLPRSGQDKDSRANCWTWDKNQYIKLMRILCHTCSKKVRRL